MKLKIRLEEQVSMLPCVQETKEVRSNFYPNLNKLTKTNSPEHRYYRSCQVYWTPSNSNLPNPPQKF